MAKRKGAGTTRRKAAPRRGAASRKRAAARTTARRKAAKRTAPKKAKGRSARKPPARKAVARKSTARKAAVTRKALARKAVARKVVASKTAAGKAGVRNAPISARSARTVVTRKAPALERARRIVQGDDIVVATPPSSLNLDRTASAARTGRRELRERIDEHTETGPALTAGDVDADWESAYSVGDEAPGGDNPTPDQDVVDDIGKAVGVQYEDNEELKGEAKITKRDKHRWELDPASSEDYDDR